MGSFEVLKRLKIAVNLEVGLLVVSWLHYSCQNRTDPAKLEPTKLTSFDGVYALEHAESLPSRLKCARCTTSREVSQNMGDRRARFKPPCDVLEESSCRFSERS